MPRIFVSLIQSDFRSGAHGNFEAVLLRGTELWHFFYDNSDVNKAWSKGQFITQSCAGWVV